MANDPTLHWRRYPGQSGPCHCEPWALDPFCTCGQAQRCDIQRIQDALGAAVPVLSDRIGVLEEALREIARNVPDTNMSRERVEGLLAESAQVAEGALRHDSASTSGRGESLA